MTKRNPLFETTDGEKRMFDIIHGKPVCVVEMKTYNKDGKYDRTFTDFCNLSALNMVYNSLVINGFPKPTLWIHGARVLGY